MRRYGIHNLGILSVPEQAAGFPGLTYTQRVEATGPIAYWVMGEAAGATSIDQINSPLQDGTYTAVTLGQPGIGDGNTCPLFSGTPSHNNIYSATFNGVFNGSEGTLLIWLKIQAAQWTDGVARDACRIQVDGNNFVIIRKSSVNNTVSYFYNAGATLETVNHASGSTDWICAALTWSKAADEVRAYFGGTQTGLTQTVLGNWAGALSNTATLIGAGVLPATALFLGNIAHVPVWSSALAPATIASLSRV